MSSGHRDMLHGYEPGFTALFRLARIARSRTEAMNMATTLTRPEPNQWWKTLDEKPEALDLSGFDLKSADLKKLKGATFLKTLDLGNNPELDNKAPKALAGLSQLEHLDLRGCLSISGGLAPLTQLPLRSLRLDGCRGLTAASLKPIGKLTQLRELSLAGVGATPNTAKLAGGLTELRHLDLSWDLPVLFARGVRGAYSNPPFSQGVQSAGLYKLRKLEQLQHLALRHQYLENLVGRVSKLPALTSLDISFCYADPEGPPAPYGKLKDLKEVIARGASGVATGGIFADIEKMKSLERFDLEGADVHESMWKLLCKGKSLRWLRVPANTSTEWVEKLRQELPDCKVEHQPPLGYVCFKVDDELRRTGLCANGRWIFRSGFKEDRCAFLVDRPRLELVRYLDGGLIEEVTLEPDSFHSTEAEALVNPIDYAALI